MEKTLGSAEEALGVLAGDPRWGPGLPSDGRVGKATSKPPRSRAERGRGSAGKLGPVSHRLLPEPLRAPGGSRNTWARSGEPRDVEAVFFPRPGARGGWVTRVLAFVPHTI